MYPATSIFVAVGRLSIVLLTIFSYPLQVHPCRAAIDKVIYPPRTPVGALGLPEDEDEDEDGDERSEQGDEERDGDDDDAIAEENGRPSHDVAAARLLGALRGPPPDEMPLQRWVLITACILTTTFTIALLVDDLSIILGFVGSLGSTTISFILPGVLYASLHDTSDRLRRPAQALAAWGVFVAVVAVTANVLKLIHAGVAVGAAAKEDRLASLVARW